MVNRLFPLPSDPRVEAKSRLQVYFNYGWSVEAKLRREVGPTDETGAPLMLSGWIDRIVEPTSRRDTEPTPGNLLASFYGMSFSGDIAQAMAELDPGIRLRTFGGPAAPPNHSYAIYDLDRGGRSDVVVLGILASSVQGLATNNAMTWRFEGPAPFTYPRYFAGAAGAEAEWPTGARSKTSCAAGRPGSVAGVSLIDPGDRRLLYNEFLLRHDVGDYSALVRMVRRAVAQRRQASRIGQIHGPSGFVADSPVIESLRVIIAAFAANARRDGKVPIALLIQDQGYRDHLYKALEPLLTGDKIPY